MTTLEAMLLPASVSALADQAHRLRRADAESVYPSTVEMALHKAFRRVEDDLQVIARQTAAGGTIDYPALLGAEADEKLAAYLLLCKYTLIDLAHLSREVLDIEYSHRNLAVFAEIFFRTGAVDALIHLFLFAQDNLRRPTLFPRIWQNVSAHCMMLLTMMEEQRARVAHFFATTPTAFEQLEQLISFRNPEGISRLVHDCLDLRRHPMPAPEPPPYLKLFTLADPDLPMKSVLGQCSSVSAHKRILQAFSDADMPAVLRWFLDGSAPAAGEVLCQARKRLPPKLLVSFLAAFFTPEHMPSEVRRAALVLELCALNVAERPATGMGEINRLLFETAMTPDETQLQVAVLAVRALFRVKNIDALLVIAEQAPLLRLAEEALYCIKDLRQLPAIEKVVIASPRLRPAFFHAQQELQEINWLMENVWTCDNDAILETYLARLTALNARDELDKIAKLVEKKGTLNALSLARFS
jgi:hypothetical protein